MDNWLDKFLWITERQKYTCPIAWEKKHVRKVPTELHHARIHNTKAARKKYPLFIDSVFNLVAVEHSYHMTNGSWGKWPESRVKRYEEFLQRHPKWAQWANNPC